MRDLVARVEVPVACVAIGAYGRRELTPHGDVDVLFVHGGGADQRMLTSVVCYPLWERHIRAEPLVRTVDECAADARKSLIFATTLLEARFVAGDAALFEQLRRQVVEPLRRDRKQLRQRLRADVAHRHATHAAATSAGVPDIVAGRGGVVDASLLRWVEPAHARASATRGASSGLNDVDEPLRAARDVLLAVVSAAEDASGHRVQRLGRRLQERLAPLLGFESTAALMYCLRAHARWVAFRLDDVFAPPRSDRVLGPHLALRRGRLVGTDLPTLEAMPSLGLRVANLVGFAPPDERLMRWARGADAAGANAMGGDDGAAERSRAVVDDTGASQGNAGVLVWDTATLEQFWLLLRAADWRAFEFLDVSGLLVRYLPELAGIWRADNADPHASPARQSETLDTHSFLALRRLHEWTDSGDAFAERIWKPLRQRDVVYLAVLLHELDETTAARAALRLRFSHEQASAIGFVAAEHDLLARTASRRDLHDEDLLFELAARIGSPQRLRQLLLVGIAHELAVGDPTTAGWQADLVRQLFNRLDLMLRQRREVGARQRRSVEHHRQRISAALERKGLTELLPVVARLPRRYVLARSSAFIARHLRLLTGAPLHDGEVRLAAHTRAGLHGAHEVLMVARDRPGLLATFAGVLALRGATVLAADAATCSDGLVLDVFTVRSAYGLSLERSIWKRVGDDLQAALDGHLPLHDLLGSPAAGTHVRVSVDNAASQFFSLVEVRAPDQVGLLYRIARGLHDLGLDIHHAKITTPGLEALDVFYVRDSAGNKLREPEITARTLAMRLGDTA